MLRGFDSLADLAEERARALGSENPFNCVEHLVDLRFDSYRPPEDFPAARGARGLRAGLRVPHLSHEAERRRPDHREARGGAGPPALFAARHRHDGLRRPAAADPDLALSAPRRPVRGAGEVGGRRRLAPKGGPDWLDPDTTSAVALPLPFSPLQ